MKIQLPGSILGPDTFADVEAAHGTCAAHLLVYLGGAVSPSEYLARRGASPTALLSLLRPAGACHAALVISYPPALSGRPENAAEALLEHFDRELLPAPPVRPERMALVGFSLGAALAVLLARAGGRRVVRLATLGAVGAAEALAHAGPGLAPLACPVLVARNTGDPCAPHSDSFVTALEAAGVSHDVETGQGGHAFPEYVASGLLPAAVAFAAREFPKTF